MKMGAMVRPSAPAIAIPPLPALLPATGVDMATPPGPTCEKSVFKVVFFFQRDVEKEEDER